MISSRCLGRLTINCGLTVRSGRGVTSSGVFRVAFGTSVLPELRLSLVASVSSDWANGKIVSSALSKCLRFLRYTLLSLVRTKYDRSSSFWSLTAGSRCFESFCTRMIWPLLISGKIVIVFLLCLTRDKLWFSGLDNLRIQPVG